MSLARTTDTRDRLAQALKESLRTARLSQVTVAGLTARAGVRRQTFYYHFDDVHDLTTWVFTTEVADHVLAHASHARWAEGFQELLEYLRANREQCEAVTRSLTHVELERFLHAQLRAMMEAVVTELESEDPRLRAAPEDRDFVVEHYTLSVLGHLLHWLATEMAAEPEILVQRLQRLLDGSVSASLARFADGGTTGHHG